MIFNIIKNSRFKLKKNKKKNISKNKFEEYKSEFKNFYDEANSKLQQFNLNDWKVTFDYAKRRAGACIYSKKELSLDENSPLENSKDNDDLYEELEDLFI